VILTHYFLVQNHAIPCLDQVCHVPRSLNPSQSRQLQVQTFLHRKSANNKHTEQFCW